MAHKTDLTRNPLATSASLLALIARSSLWLCVAMPGASQPQSSIVGAREFEVASVKRSTPKSARRSQEGGPGTKDPGRFSFTRAVLRDLLFRAYGLQDYQSQVSGPGWIDSEEYDVEARFPATATKEEFQEMLRNLLMERFSLSAHREPRRFAAYDLVGVTFW